MKMDSNNVFITLPYDARHVAKEVLNGSWSAKHKAWRFPKSVLALDEIASKFPSIAHTDAFKEIYDKLKRGRMHLSTVKAYEPLPDPNSKLRPYQRQDVQYLTQIPSAGIFNQPRTGKTPTCIAAIKERGTVLNVVIVPASLLYNWKREIETWYPTASVFMAVGSPSNRLKEIESFKQQTDPAFLIVSKDTAKRQVDDLSFAIETLTVDEAHYLRNNDTKQSEAVYKIGSFAKHRYALTGTPTVKHPVDIYGILKFLYPHKFTSYWAFVDRYFDVTDNGFGKDIGDPKPHRVAELQDIIDAMSTQRLRKDVMQWLPDKTRHRHICRMGAKQNKMYQSMLEDFFAQDGDVEIDAQNVLAQLMRLRQICLDPQLLGATAPSAKTDAFIEALEDGVYDEPLVVMSMFTSYLQMLRPMIESLGKRVEMITGETPNHRRAHYVAEFQAGRIDILLCNIISAGTGLTLDRGEVIVFLDKAWNPSDNEQAEDRITPTTEERNHKQFIVSFVCENSIEERIEKLLENKQSLTAIVNECKTIKDLKRWLA
jgi:SNF2 family DNA or RNA helicase